MLSLRPSLSLPRDAASALAPPPVAGYVIALRPLARLQASEQVHPDRVQALAQRIRDEGRWLAPLPIDEASGLVMDGNHRLRAAHLLGLRRLPCVLLDYADPRVAVACWRSGRPLDPRDIVAALAGRELLPPKSTRHRFDPPLPATRIELALLR
jgi:ParB-like chromosome segregation protein Spo0J